MTLVDSIRFDSIRYRFSAVALVDAGEEEEEEKDKTSRSNLAPSQFIIQTRRQFYQLRLVLLF